MQAQKVSDILGNYKVIMVIWAYKSKQAKQIVGWDYYPTDNKK